jgi:hypothetical protein
MATSITILAREPLTSTRKDVSAVRYSAYFTRLRVAYNDLVSRLMKVYAKSEVVAGVVGTQTSAEYQSDRRRAARLSVD